MSRILRRHQVHYLRERDPLTGQAIRSSPDGGWRAQGRAAASTSRDTAAKIRFDFAHPLAAHGIDRIERVMIDNAWANEYSLREVVATLGARQVFIRPRCPWQNGKWSGSTAPWPP